MVFSSATFLFAFLPLVLALVLVVPKIGRNLVLLVSSLLFYAWGEGWLVSLMLASIAMNHGLGLLIERTGDKKFLIAGIALNLGFLGVFKYTDFILENINSVVGTSIELTQLSLPIGISFFTFQGLSYLVDVWRKDIPAEKSVLSFGTYISFFPQLIAGPIVRYSTIAKDLHRVRFSQQGIVKGIELFSIGLLKKLLFANTAGKVADDVFNLPEPAMGMAWIGVICYALQIYFDFSGYSDMAVGLGRVFGFRFPLNFKHPYAAGSMQDFWRRWHITLSTWFRDYLYIPLGGNRKGPFRLYFNLLAVFFFTGLWHGASWNFVAWGLWHGIFLLLERALRNSTIRFPKILSPLYLWWVVLMGWVFFRAENLQAAVDYLSIMYGITEGYNWTALRLFSNYQTVILLLGLLACWPIRKYLVLNLYRLTHSTVTPQFAKFGFLLLVLVFCSFELASSTFNPFIYFRF